MPVATKANGNGKAVAAKDPVQGKRTYLSQEDVPSYSLEEALRVAEALATEYAGKPKPPLDVAAALQMLPSSSTFRMLCGASIAFGLTEGGAQSALISLTPLGKRIVEPLAEGDDLAAKREATLKPRILRDFLTNYDKAQLPKDEIARNVLKSMNVPADRVNGVLPMILESARLVGFLRPLKDKTYVDLQGIAPPPKPANGTDPGDAGSDQPQAMNFAGLTKTAPISESPVPQPTHVVSPPALQIDPRMRRVFITHGKNTAFIEPIKKLLGFGELDPVVSVEKQSVSQPVPDKVMNDMRLCGAAIIHVDSEQVLLDKEANPVTSINPNVLIEIGAAMALYARRFILLVKDGVKLPSNLQGLYEVRYTGDVLDGNATIRLLESINELKKISLPSAG
jgi:predicted nucleotide-binding protein